MNDAEDIRRFIKNLNKSYTIPTVFTKILKIVKDENSSPQDLYRIISHDQGIAEKIVRVANSTIFGHSGQVRNIKHAIMFLGYDRIKSIAMGVSVLDIFKPDRSSFDIKNLWIHAYEVAYIAAAMSEVINMSLPEDSFLCGLLHDIGRVVFYEKDRDRFFKIGTGDDMLEKEMELFGCTHSEAGSWYAEHAGMPEDIILSIRYHHEPSKAEGNKIGVSITSLAEALSRRFSPRIEDDGIWTAEHDTIMLEFSLTEEYMSQLAQRLTGLKYEVDSFLE